MAYFSIVIRKRGFRMTPIFAGLQPAKKAAHPCTPESFDIVESFRLLLMQAFDAVVQATDRQRKHTIIH